MQQIQKSVYRKCLTGVVGIIWVTGLLIAGSDSLYMPWINGIGLILFVCATIMFGKLLQSLDPNKSVVTSSRLNSDIEVKIFNLEEHVY